VHATSNGKKGRFHIEKKKKAAGKQASEGEVGQPRFKVTVEERK